MAAIPKFDEPNLQALSDVLGDTSTGLTGSEIESRISLSELLETEPLQQGLAELIAYLQLGCDVFRIVVDESRQEFIHWEATALFGEKLLRSARLPQVIFVR